MSLRAPQLFRRNALTVAWAQRIQQRAFLRLANLTAFVEVQKLVSGFADLQHELEKTTTQLHILQSHLWSDERVILQRQRVDKDCQLDMVQNIRLLSNITARFRGELCQLPFTDGLYTGNVLRCEQSRQSEDRPRDLEATFIQAVLQLKSHRRTESQNPFTMSESFTESVPGPTTQPHYDRKMTDREAHYLATSQPGLLELQVINLFFSSTSTSPRLKDILRNYLRVLSAKRMQIRPRKSSPLQARKVSISEKKRPSEFGLTQLTGDLCSDEVHDTLSSRYHDFLEELGERIASCLQRLDTFSNTMASIVEANKAIITAFKVPVSDLTRIPQSSLVAFTIQVETVGGGLSTSRMISLDTVVNPFSEVLGICFATMGFLIPLLLLVDYAFSQMYRSHSHMQGDS
ncbi:unnamed protein product [Echinostoma caproni]|uniref:Uncharacterized protein n=1 Tax=Echinostoma caproni TaxID=27848 RepID=A0A183AFH5_9TREM|nr:unnamed protein product [Echinostoma caproni]